MNGADAGSIFPLATGAGKSLCYQLPTCTGKLRRQVKLIRVRYRHAGAGKSLCYQLPAVVGGGTVLVVSPLLALMRDQLDHLPPGLPAAMLCGGQPRAEARQVLDDLKVRRRLSPPCCVLQLRGVHCSARQNPTTAGSFQMMCNMLSTDVIAWHGPAWRHRCFSPSRARPFPSHRELHMMEGHHQHTVSRRRRASCGCCWLRRSGCTARRCGRRWRRYCRCRSSPSTRRTASPSGATTSGRPTSGARRSHSLSFAVALSHEPCPMTATCGSICLTFHTFMPRLQ